jgi:cation diffusion facilitator family transporter
MGLNLIPTFTKLFVGYLTQSLSLIADGFDSVFDAATNVVGLVGIWVAAKPADKQYPYGHRKAETITALVISYLLFLTCYELIRSAFERIFNPALISAEANFWSFAALGVSIAIHMYVVHYELNAGRKLHSDVLVADALHTRADIFISVAVGGGMVFILLGIPLADPILALVVALMIARIGIDIIRESQGYGPFITCVVEGTNRLSMRTFTSG